MLGIKSTVFEKEHYLNERPRDWSLDIYWAQSSLTECLPSSRTLYFSYSDLMLSPETCLGSIGSSDVSRRSAVFLEKEILTPKS